jgi:hypothetical protein
MIQFYAIPGPNSTLPSQQHRDKDSSPNITMMIDSGASHILVRFEHAHILKYITMSDTKTQPFANLRSAKIGSELSPIGRGLLQIGPFCFPAYIFRDNELQDSLLGLNPLTKRGCSAIFINRTFSLLHDPNKEPILHESKTAYQKIHGVWQFNNTTDTLCGTSHHQQASTKHLTTGTQSTRTKDLYHFRTHRHHTHYHPKLKGCALQEIKGCPY